MNMTVGGIIGGLVVGAALGFGVATLSGKAGKGMGSMTSGGGTSGVSSPGMSVFELDGKAFTAADLPGDVRMQLFEASHESYDRQQAVLTQYAMRLHLAKAKGVETGPGKLPPLEELLVVEEPKEEDIKQLWEANKDRLPPNTTYDQIKPEIVKYLKNQKMSDSVRTQQQQFQTSGTFKVLMSPPDAPEVKIDLASFPAKGPAGAGTMVEIADYTCPHCQMVQAEVESLLKELGDKVRFVPVAFALRPDGLSGTLARGAWCARKENDEAFWKYHEAAFRLARTKGWKSTDPDAKEPVIEIAKESGLDGEKLATCAGSAEAGEALKTTIAAMHAAGITMTPTFVVNGRLAQPHPGKPLKSMITGLLGAASH